MFILLLLLLLLLFASSLYVQFQWKVVVVGEENGDNS